ncbi:MAG: hypothetical protein MSG64_16705 [Pyrinomonadaceae bacterium MAG19_C2-C3]|nr:hypothetical protein [Pyrinomonadaceae bacterium MAG19_C2-C3]
MKDGENQTQETTPETVTVAVETPAPAAETVTSAPETITSASVPETVTAETVTPVAEVATSVAAAAAPEGFIARAEFDRAVERAEAAEARASEQAVNERNAAIDHAAGELGFHDAEDARRLVSADATDFKAALSEVLKTKSYLARPSATPVVTAIDAANPPRTEALSLEAMRGMTPAQLAANWQAVKEALKLSGKQATI